MTVIIALRFAKIQDSTVLYLLYLPNSALCHVVCSDDTSHAGNEYFDLDVVLSTVESLTSAISELGLDVYPAMGNHDAHPKNQFPDDPDSELYARTADLWSGWLGGKGDAEQQFRENGVSFANFTQYSE